jgi:hypothetical protein
MGYVPYTLYIDVGSLLYSIALRSELSSRHVADWNILDVENKFILQWNLSEFCLMQMS